VAAGAVKGVAFLRAINVGGRVVKMERLRALFEDEGFTGVQTFIASGNVIFDLAATRKTLAIERVIEAMLKNALSYDVAVFVRTAAEVRAVAEHEPFPPAAVKKSVAFNVAFLRTPPDPTSVNALNAVKTSADLFHVRGRELYWLSAVRQGESKMSNAVFEKILRQPSTVRGIGTMRKLAEKL
jgi:uncharacterized protein (DUF1697 family)